MVWLVVSYFLLVGGLEHEFYFPPIVGMMKYNLTFMFFRGAETTNQLFSFIFWDEIGWLKILQG
jgi:hypothetical protein